MEWSRLRMRNSAGVSRCGVDCMRIRTRSEEAIGRRSIVYARFRGLASGSVP